MSELLSKISSYNLYNYLLVGFVYNMLLCHYTQLGYVDESILKTLIVCYVMGLFIAKLASLFLEPLLIRLHWNNKKFLKWRNKNEYLEASFKDAKIPILLEEANVCRNIAMPIFVFFICLLYDKYVSIYIYMIVAECLFYVIAFFICIFSYKKKIRQISDRIDKSRSA